MNGDSGTLATPAPLDRAGLNKVALLQEEVANLKKALSRAESRLVIEISTALSCFR